MSLVWVILGTLAQLMLAGFLFMLVGFSAGAAANNNDLSELHETILTAFLWTLPGLCFGSAGTVIYYFTAGGGVNTYWWYMMPIVAAIIYIIYLVKLN